MTSPALTVDLARPSDAGAILELNRTAFGGRDLLATLEDFSWRYTDNPAGQAIVPVLRGEDWRPAGFIWIVPLRMRLRGETVLGATGTNLVIDPGHRAGFGYTRLLRRFEQELRHRGLVGHFSFVSEDTYARAQRREADSLTTVPLLARGLDAGAASKPGSRARWYRFLGRCADRLAAPRRSRERAVAATDQEVVTELDAPDQRFEAFWASIEDRYPASVIRDRSYLAWRFARMPGRAYRLLLAESEGTPTGYIVLRTAAIRGMPAGLLMDFRVGHGVAGERAGAALLKAAKQLFEQEGAVVSTALLSPLVREYHLLKRHGYHRVPAVLAPRRFRLLTAFEGRAASGQPWPRARDWFVTLADWEAY